MPNSCFCNSFFFDHEYTFKCNRAQTQSAKALNACPGSAFFKYQQKFFEDHYRVYDGGVEGIRNACESDGQKCYFHTYVQNSKVLNPDGWSDICVKRVNAPVLDYSDNEKFCEKFSFKKANVLSDARKTNDFGS